MKLYLILKSLFVIWKLLPNPSIGQFVWVGVCVCLCLSFCLSVSLFPMSPTIQSPSKPTYQLFDCPPAGQPENHLASYCISVKVKYGIMLCSNFKMSSIPIRPWIFVQPTFHGHLALGIKWSNILWVCGVWWQEIWKTIESPVSFEFCLVQLQSI